MAQTPANNYSTSFQQESISDLKMRLASSVLAAVLAGATTAGAFAPSVTKITTTAAAARTERSLKMSAVEQDERKMTKKDERLRFMKSDNFYRQGFKEVRGAVEDVMGKQFKSSTVDELKSSNYVMDRDGVKVYLAKVRR
jgi:4-hydroxy-3-methylbut-2-en-1-yl diphosphate reductase